MVCKLPKSFTLLFQFSPLTNRGVGGTRQTIQHNNNQYYNTLYLYGTGPASGSKRITNCHKPTSRSEFETKQSLTVSCYKARLIIPTPHPSQHPIPPGLSTPKFTCTHLVTSNPQHKIILPSSVPPSPSGYSLQSSQFTRNRP